MEKDFFKNIEYWLASLENSYTKLGQYLTKNFYKPEKGGNKKF